MTEKEFLDLVMSRRAPVVLDALARLSAKDRRALAKPAMGLLKKIDRAWLRPDEVSELRVKDGEAVTVAVLATASASELKKLSFFPRPGKIPLKEIVGRLRPDWLQEVVDHFVEVRLHYVEWFQPLWDADLCRRPDSDAVILHYYRYMATLRGVDEEKLLAGDVWRFFEVEGGGEDSLANHDKFLKNNQESWADRLRRYADEGRLDRQRLLDASLDALERDFAQYRAGWYSRFHVLLAPDPDEQALRAGRYLGLLGSSIPPTVSFAMKHVQALEKAGKLDPSELLMALDPALQARAKGTVMAALKLLKAAAKRRPALRAVAASKAVLALVSEDAGVQGKALDVVEALGSESVTADLADYVELVAPSVRPRIVALTGGASKPTGPVDFEIPAQTAQGVVPAASPEEALALFLRVLEEPRNPVDVERAVDAISRFGAALQSAETALSPLRKRARQVCKSPGYSAIRFVLAMTGRALAERADLGAILIEETEGRADHALVPPLSLQAFHLARNRAVVARLNASHSLPLLSLPSNGSGHLEADDLLARMTQYRAAGAGPDLDDLALALMRLDPVDRSSAQLPSDTEAERAVAYALGAEVTVGPTPALWAAAWRARLTEFPDDRIVQLFDKPTPDCGVPARMALEVKSSSSEGGEYTWIDVEVPVTPANEIKSRALPALFGLKARNHFDDACNGHTFADIAWASLTRPANPEPFFRAGLIYQDSWQKLADNPTCAYLEPFFRPGPPVGNLGAAILAYYMACEDKSVSSLAIEATASLAGEGRLSRNVFTNALKQFLMSQCLPTGRWTKGMKAVADFGAGGFARDVIVGLLDFAPDDTPRDIGGLLELCYELHVAENARLADAGAIACLQSIPGGGKTARFRKKLLELA